MNPLQIRVFHGRDAAFAAAASVSRYVHVCMFRRASIVVRFLTLCAPGVSAVRFCSEVKHIIQHRRRPCRTPFRPTSIAFLPTPSPPSAPATKRGRTLLAQALRIDPRNETAWLGMASVAETPERRRECLERALAINPNNEGAHRALKALSDPPPSRAPHDASAPDHASRPSSSSDLEHAQTIMQAEGTPPDKARHCPQCGAPTGATDMVCAFCKRLIAPSSSDVLSYPKHTPLTREDQRRLTGQSLKRIGVPHLLNTTTIVGIVITCIAGAIIAWTIQQNWTAHPGVLFLSLLLPLLFLIPGIINIIQGTHMYRFAQSLHNATAVAEAPILDVWQDEGFEGEPFVVAWELTVIDQYGKTRCYRQAQKIDKELYDCLQTRATVQVRYAPDQPDTSMLDEQWVTAIKGASST
jgi:hypothetical protein